MDTRDLTLRKVRVLEGSPGVVLEALPLGDRLRGPWGFRESS